MGNDFAHAGYYFCSITLNYLLLIMEKSFYISPRVIDTINSLPESDRQAITLALSHEFILGNDPYNHLTPVQGMLYAMIRHYVEQDTERNRRLASEATASTSASPFRAVGA